jgi:hypothetical protein
MDCHRREYGATTKDEEESGPAIGIKEDLGDKKREHLRGFYGTIDNRDKINMAGAKAMKTLTICTNA